MRLLDLFCGAGGAAMGYSRAGFDDIVGVDNRPMPRYPFTFVLADALEFVHEHGHEFDAIHASPPCQAYCDSANRVKHPRLIEPTRRELLKMAKVAWVIENVDSAPLRWDWLLCGTMFPPLRVIRHRAFETNVAPSLVWPCNHWGRVSEGQFAGVYGRGARGKRWIENGKRHRMARPFRWGQIPEGRARREWWSEAMGINWMTIEELREAIPPAYTEFVGRQLIAALRALPGETP